MIGQQRHNNEGRKTGGREKGRKSDEQEKTRQKSWCISGKLTVSLGQNDGLLQNDFLFGTLPHL